MYVACGTRVCVRIFVTMGLGVFGRPGDTMVGILVTIERKRGVVWAWSMLGRSRLEDAWRDWVEGVLWGRSTMCIIIIGWGNEEGKVGRRSLNGTFQKNRSSYGCIGRIPWSRGGWPVRGRLDIPVLRLKRRGGTGFLDIMFYVYSRAKICVRASRSILDSLVKSKSRVNA